MFIFDLFEATQPQQTLVIIPGGYHPFHPGHLSLYKSAQKAFPNATIVYAATDDRKERPFAFDDKAKLAAIAGVPQGHFQLVRSPFVAKEITQNFDPNTTALVFVRSEKDRNEQPQAGTIKKDGSPSYLQPLPKGALAPMSQHGYMAYLPVVQFDAGPSGVTSATQIREMWPNASPAQKAEIVQDLYPKNPQVAQQILDKYLGQGVAEGLPRGGFSDEEHKSQGEEHNVRRVDMTGKECEKCHAGDYQETGVQDDMHGVLHCTNCGEQTDRWKMYRGKGVAEGFSDIVKGVKRVVKGKTDPTMASAHRSNEYIKSLGTGDKETIRKAERNLDRVNKVTHGKMSEQGVAEGDVVPFKKPAPHIPGYVFSGEDYFMDKFAPRVFKKFGIKIISLGAPNNDADAADKSAMDYGHDESIREYYVNGDPKTIEAAGRALEQAASMSSMEEAYGGYILANDFNSLSEQGVAEATRKPAAPKFTKYTNYELWERERYARGANYSETEIDGRLVGVAVVGTTYNEWGYVRDTGKVVGMWYNKASIGSFVQDGTSFDDSLSYAEQDTTWPYMNESHGVAEGIFDRFKKKEPNVEVADPGNYPRIGSDIAQWMAATVEYHKATHPDSLWKLFCPSYPDYLPTRVRVGTSEKTIRAHLGDYIQLRDANPEAKKLARQKFEPNHIYPNGPRDDYQNQSVAEASFDREEFRRHMKDLEAREELRKTDPVSAKALDLRGQLPQQSKKKPEDDSMSINDPRHPQYAYTQAGQQGVAEGFFGNKIYYVSSENGETEAGSKEEAQALVAKLKKAGILASVKVRKVKEGIGSDMAKLGGIAALGVGGALVGNYSDTQQPKVEIGGQIAFVEPSHVNVPDNAMTLTGKDGKTYRVWSTKGTAQSNKRYHAVPVKQVKEQAVAKTIYPNAEVIKSKNGKPIGEIYRDASGWGCFHYNADNGADCIASREEALEWLKDLADEYRQDRRLREGNAQDPNAVQLNRRARHAHPLAQSDEEALALYVNDREIKDVDRLEYEQNKERRMLDRISQGEQDLEQHLQNLEAELASLVHKIGAK